MLYVILLIVIIVFIFAFLMNQESKPKIQKSQEQIERENAIIEIIEEAIKNNKNLYITYESSYGYSGNEYTERIVIPKAVYRGDELNKMNPLEKGEWIDEEFYLLAYCKLRKEERHFRVDRIQSIKIIY